ncbi:glycosyltransferase [Ningiella sp. W23]|uniref:glycosyltransferase n=1 Tax=Ningiella sp. W23 TaxID=3023715 RepID=UPI003756959C
MIKVCHLTYDMRIGGAEMVIKNIIEGSDNAEFDMSLFCLETPLGPWGIALKQDGLTVGEYSRQPGFDLQAIKMIRQFVKQNEIDVLHCHQYTPWFYGTIACLGLHTKIIFTEHGRFYPDIRSPKRRFINPILRFFTAKITAISKATANALQEFEYIPLPYTQVIYNGISEQNPELKCNIRNSLNIDSDTLILGTIARFDPIKNHLMMLEGLHLALQTGVKAHFLLVGDGEHRQTIEQKIEALNLDGHVTMTGYISAPFDYLHAMDVFLLTSFSEGTSMTLLEAMRDAKPCIVTDVGGNPEVIEHDYNGIVIPSGDSKKLANAIGKLAVNEDIREGMGKKAIQLFRKKFSASQMNIAFGEIYRALSGRQN